MVNFHGFDSCWGLSFFLCPTLLTYEHLTFINNLLVCHFCNLTYKLTYDYFILVGTTLMPGKSGQSGQIEMKNVETTLRFRFLLQPRKQEKFVLKIYLAQFQKDPLLESETNTPQEI